MTQSDDQLEQRLRHRFVNRRLLDRALTHSSAVADLRTGRIPAELTSEGGSQNNEQLEFLGDAILDMLASEYLLQRFPDWSEGQLSKSRSQIVNARALELAARRVKLGEHLRIGRGEEKTGGREKPALLADAFEALVAAIYLDAGLGAARVMLQGILFDHALEEHGVSLADSDGKSALQEFLQGNGEPFAEYRLTAECGPDHRKTFQIEVWIGGTLMASGEGSTKKEAEQRAARSALQRLQAMAIEKR